MDNSKEILSISETQEGWCTRERKETVEARTGSSRQVGLSMRGKYGHVLLLLTKKQVSQAIFPSSIYKDTQFTKQLILKDK